MRRLVDANGSSEQLLNPPGTENLGNNQNNEVQNLRSPLRRDLSRLASAIINL